MESRVHHLRISPGGVVCDPGQSCCCVTLGTEYNRKISSRLIKYREGQNIINDSKAWMESVVMSYFSLDPYVDQVVFKLP